MPSCIITLEVIAAKGDIGKMWYTFFCFLFFLVKFSLHLALQLKHQVFKSQTLPSSHQNHFQSLLVTNQSPASSDDSRLPFKTTEEATASLAVAAETSMDAAVAEVLPGLADFFFFFPHYQKKEEQYGWLYLVGRMFSLHFRLALVKL